MSEIVSTELKLSERHRAFVDEYFENGFNAKQAAITLWGESNSHNIGYRELHHPAVRAEIERRFAEMQIGPNEVLARFAEIARGESGNYITATGNIDFKALIADGKGHLIKSIRDTRNGKAVEFYDAMDALDKAARVLGLYKNKVELTGEGGGPITLAAVQLSTEEELRRLEARQRLLKRKLEEGTVIDGELEKNG